MLAKEKQSEQDSKMLIAGQVEEGQLGGAESFERIHSAEKLFQLLIRKRLSRLSFVGGSGETMPKPYWAAFFVP